MENVSSATLMFDLAHWLESVMSATTALTKVDVSFVEVLVSQMLITAKSVQSWRRM